MGHTVIRSAFYRPQRSCLQGNVFTPVCHSVHRGGVSQHALGSHDQPPLYNTGVGWQTPPGHPCPHRHPARQTPPRAPMPSQTPSQADTPLGRHPLLGRHPSWVDTPWAEPLPSPARHPSSWADTPLDRQPSPPRDGHCYWNAFLFKEYVGFFSSFFSSKCFLAKLYFFNLKPSNLFFCAFRKIPLFQSSFCVITQSWQCCHFCIVS